jgi:hypothetical protein
MSKQTISKLNRFVMVEDWYEFLGWALHEVFTSMGDGDDDDDGNGGDGDLDTLASAACLGMLPQRQRLGFAAERELNIQTGNLLRTSTGKLEALTRLNRLLKAPNL